MKTRMALLIFALTILAAQRGFAQANTGDAYQKTLLDPTKLSSDDSDVCAARQATSGNALIACTVTRLLLADIAAGKDKGKPWPPLANILYTANADERAMLQDAQTRHMSAK